MYLDYCGSRRKWVVMYQSIIISLICLSSTLYGHSYSITPETKIVGNHEAKVLGIRTLAQFCEKYSIGYDALLKANPFLANGHVNHNTVLIVPKTHILPQKRQGVIVNLAEKQLYFFPDKTHVYIYPIGIGRQKWSSPEGVFWLRDKRHKPTWYVPDSVKEEELAKGISLPKSIPPGEENPLGDYAIRLSYTSFLIHGTNDPSGIGKESTSGCFSMYNQDIAELYANTTPGQMITIENKPLSWYNTPDEIVLAAYQPSDISDHELPQNISLDHKEDIQDILSLAQGIPQSITLKGES